MQKKCKTCGVWKPLEQYRPHWRTSDGKMTVCQACYDEKYSPIVREEFNSGRSFSHPAVVYEWTVIGKFYDYRTACRMMEQLRKRGWRQLHIRIKNGVCWLERPVRIKRVA